MKGPRAVSHAVIIASMIGGLVAPTGCGGHPDEGILKTPPRRRETPDPPLSKKSSPASRKNRPTSADRPVGK